MSSYYKCQLFNQEIKDYTNFSFIQDELLLKNFNGSSSSFEKLNIEYKCSFEEYGQADWTKPTGIICIKDNVELLKFTLENLKQYNVYKYVNFIIVDDRSINDIKIICKEYPVSYLRVDNQKGFNFSSLNNIAAKIAHDKKSEQIILWNSDLWAPDEQTIPKLLELHKINDSTISGTKLLYPEFSWNNDEGPSHNIQSVFSNKSSSYRGTIQFGGGLFILNDSLNSFFPYHYLRFKNKNYYLSNQNKLDNFVTGAFQIINLIWFFESGGLNPSMSLNFQDVDLCLKAIENDKKIYFFGENLFLYHDESISISKQKNSNQFTSDNILYSKIWNKNKFIKDILKFEV